MNFTENKSFCALAYVHMAAHTDGTVRLCCISDRFIKDKEGNKFNLGINSTDEILNSEDFKSIRKDMLEGKPIKGCEECYNNEKYSSVSYRTKNNAIWSHKKNFLTKLNQSKNDIKIDPTVEFLEVRYGNLCNLSCRYCYPEASSQYNKEMKKINELYKIDFATTEIDYNQWYQTKTFKENIEKQIPHITKYYAAGGEPTIIDAQIDLMKYMVDSGHSKHIELQISTNVTNTKSIFYELLPFFKKVVFLASIDGVGKMQEYMRYPSSWEQIDQNFRKIIALNMPNTIIRITPVLQKINLEFITDLFEYAEIFNRDLNSKKVSVAPIILNLPKFYDFLYLPLDYKLMCLDKIQNWVKTQCKYQDHHFYSSLKIIKEKCTENIDDKNNLKQFFHYNDALDKHRNHNLKHVNPYLDSLRYK